MNEIPEAASPDVASVEAIVAALYDTISGPVGKARDWNRLRPLFYPRAPLLRTTVSAEGVVGMAAMDIETLNGPILALKAKHTGQSSESMPTI